MPVPSAVMPMAIVPVMPMAMVPLIPSVLDGFDANQMNRLKRRRWCRRCYDWNSKRHGSANKGRKKKPWSGTRQLGVTHRTFPSNRKTESIWLLPDMTDRLGIYAGPVLVGFLSLGLAHTTSSTGMPGQSTRHHESDGYPILGSATHAQQGLSNCCNVAG
jgi:hypothetical protein